MASLALLAMVGLLTQPGCRDRRPARVAVEGTVTVDGKPLEEGTILFIPYGTVVGPKAGGNIEQGRYSLPAEDGPMIGSLRVEIRCEAIRQPAVYTVPQKSERAAHPRPARQQIVLPARYNVASTLTVETKPREANQFDFTLTTTP